MIIVALAIVAGRELQRDTLNDNNPGYVVNLGVMELWVKAWLRPVNRIELAKTGSADKYKIEAELTLESRNQLGSGMITGLYYSYN